MDWVWSTPWSEPTNSYQSDWKGCWLHWWTECDPHLGQNLLIPTWVTGRLLIALMDRVWSIPWSEPTNSYLSDWKGCWLRWWTECDPPLGQNLLIPTWVTGRVADCPDGPSVILPEWLEGLLIVLMDRVWSTPWSEPTNSYLSDWKGCWLRWWTECDPPLGQNLLIPTWVTGRVADCADGPSEILPEWLEGLLIALMDRVWSTPWSEPTNSYLSDWKGCWLRWWTECDPPLGQNLLIPTWVTGRVADCADGPSEILPEWLDGLLIALMDRVWSTPWSEPRLALLCVRTWPWSLFNRWSPSPASVTWWDCWTTVIGWTEDICCCWDGPSTIVCSCRLAGVGLCSRFGLSVPQYGVNWSDGSKPRKQVKQL